jgi:argininosuccinate lyase
MLVLLKGLPLTYNRDLQLDKPPLFQSVDKVKDMLELLTKLFASLKVNKAVVKKRTNNETLFSVDIMEYLIKKGVSYREAHNIVGTMIKKCTDKGKSIADLTEKQLKSYCPKFGLDVKKLLNPEMSVKIKKSLGSTNPASVEKQITNWKKLLHA